MPACGEAPEEIAKAIASGSATSPTVMPATQSRRNFLQLYWRSARARLGVQAERRASLTLPNRRGQCGDLRSERAVSPGLPGNPVAAGTVLSLPNIARGRRDFGVRKRASRMKKTFLSQ